MDDSTLKVDFENSLSEQFVDNQKDATIDEKDDTILSSILDSEKYIVENLPIDSIVADIEQPRKTFDQHSLNELAESIKNFGVIQPVIVTKYGSKFKLVAGERRFRASKLAGMNTIPAIIKDYSEKEKHEISLIENIQRENLNPIDEAKAYKALMEEFDFTQEELAAKLGKSRPVIANSLRLLSLTPTVRDLVASGRLSQGHARCLASIKIPNVQISYALGACDKQLSVRQLEKMIFNYSHKTKPKKVIAPTSSAELRDLVKHMQDLFGTKIMAMGNNSKGRILIDYYTQVDLERIYEVILLLKRK